MEVRSAGINNHYYSYPWAKYYVLFDDTPESFIELETWCKDNLQYKWELSTVYFSEHFVPNICIIRLYIESEEDMVLIKLRFA